MSLPPPDAAASAQSEALCARIREDIVRAGGWIPFSRYMELALYAPSLGYYTGGARKFGQAGDFVTGPELSPLFARCLAVQVAQVTAACGDHVIEVGPGSGILAAELLATLEARGALPASYGLLELSAELRDRQRATIDSRVPHLAARAYWLEQLPPRFAGAVIANELLDALPADLVAWRGNGVCERGVELDANGCFAWAERPARASLARAALDLPVAAPYESEIGMAGRAWVASWGSILERGVLILVDYGFPGAEFYHPQRSTGTLMCHYRQRAHGDPFLYPGLGDITAHVDFSALAQAGAEVGLELYGYLSQGQFLLNCGLAEMLAAGPPTESVDYLRLAAGAQRLISPSEMGELFKVMLLGRGLEEVPVAAARGDRSHRL